MSAYECILQLSIMQLERVRQQIKHQITYKQFIKQSHVQNIPASSSFVPSFVPRCSSPRWKMDGRLCSEVPWYVGINLPSNSSVALKNFCCTPDMMPSQHATRIFASPSHHILLGPSLPSARGVGFRNSGPPKEERKWVQKLRPYSFSSQCVESSFGWSSREV